MRSKISNTFMISRILEISGYAFNLLFKAVLILTFLFKRFVICACLWLRMSLRNILQANPDYKGVCHVALAQEGHCRPGEVLLGTDSHTCNAGAFGQFASGIGNTDAGFVMGTGKSLLKVCKYVYM